MNTSARLLEVGKWTTGGAAAVLAFLFGPMGPVKYVMLACIALDYITAIIAASYNKELSSRVGFKGLLRKGTYIAVWSLAHLMDAYVLNLNGVLVNFVLGYIIANEGLSIMENVAKAGGPIPPKLVEALKQLKDRA